MKTQNERSAKQSAKKDNKQMNNEAARQARILNNEARKKAEAEAEAKAAREAAKKAEAEAKAARAQEREEKRVSTLLAAADKAAAWRQAKGLANKAGGQERDMLLSAAAAIINGKDNGTAYTYIYRAVYDLASPDFQAVLPAIPAQVLARAIYRDGSLKPSAVARIIAAEIAANEGTALAAAQAASEAARAARIAAKKAARKAAQKERKQGAAQ